MKETGGLYFDETPFVRQIVELNGNIDPHFVAPSKRPIIGQIAEQIPGGRFPRRQHFERFVGNGHLRCSALVGAQRHARAEKWATVQ